MYVCLSDMRLLRMVQNPFSKTTGKHTAGIIDQRYNCQ